MKTNRSIPVFNIKDIDASVRFYWWETKNDPNRSVRDAAVSRAETSRENMPWNAAFRFIVDAADCVNASLGTNGQWSC